MKSIRHTRIKDIIENKVIETQEELAEELRKKSIDVTQATVSRDIFSPLSKFRIYSVDTPIFCAR